MIRTINNQGLLAHIMWGMLRRDGVDGYFTRHVLMPKNPGRKGVRRYGR